MSLHFSLLNMETALAFLYAVDRLTQEQFDVSEIGWSSDLVSDAKTKFLHTTRTCFGTRTIIFKGLVIAAKV